MKTTKERLATAIQVPLDESLTFYHTSLNGLTEEQVEKTVSSKRFTNRLSILLQSSYWSSP